MLRDIFLAFPHLQRYLDQDEALSSLIYPGPAWGDDATKAQRDALTDTRAAQPGLRNKVMPASVPASRFET